MAAGISSGGSSVGRGGGVAGGSSISITSSGVAGAALVMAYRGIIANTMAWSESATASETLRPLVPGGGSATAAGAEDAAIGEAGARTTPRV